MSFSLFQKILKKNGKKKHISVQKLFEEILSHFLDIKKNAYLKDTFNSMFIASAFISR